MKKSRLCGGTEYIIMQMQPQSELCPGGRYLPEGSRIGTAENRTYLSSVKNLETAIRDHAILEAIAVLCDTELNLHVDLCGIPGIIPREEAIWCRPGEPFKDIAVITRVGKPVCFFVTGIEVRDGVPTALLSRRAVQKECAEVRLPALKPGDLVRTKVTHLENFGAFVDVGCGIASLLSVDCISVSRISHPRDRLTPGMFLWNVVKTVDPETGRLFLSMRELLGTWEENAAQFEAGQTVTGIIRSVEEYGIFVELTPNLAGLAELRDDLTLPAEQLIGAGAAVYIKSIVPDRMKIKLVLIDVCREPKRPLPPKYYIDVEHTESIRSWRYSPDGARRVIESVFGEE